MVNKRGQIYVRDQGPCMDQLIDDMKDLAQSTESVFQEKEEILEIWLVSHL